ncbi:MAG TPA: hypothetical protein VF981_12335 [Gemmatimonadaceae bacterium]
MRTHEAAGPLEPRLKRLVRDIPDYPKPGIVFKDITPVLGHAAAFSESCTAMGLPYREPG